MPKNTHAPYRHQQRAGLIGAVLCLSMWMAWAQDDVLPWATQASVEETQKSLQQLSHQIGQFRRSALQAELNQTQKSQAIQQQVDRQINGIEQRQNALARQLAELQQNRLQHIKDLQEVNRKLVAALWALGILGLLLLLCLWRCRKPVNTPTATDAPRVTPSFTLSESISASPSTYAANAAAAAANAPEARPQAAPENAAVVADASQTLDTLSSLNPVSQQPQQPPMATPADLTAPWSDLVRSDLQNTQNALAQARQGFMRTAPLEP